MSKVNITIATWDYDRVRPIMDGRVTVEGCDVNFIVVPPEECFHRAWNNQDFDVTEIGTSGYIIGTSRGQGLGGISPYVAIPVFLSRSFRVSGIYVRKGSGIEKPEDLKGKRVGVPEYQITAAVWSRGFLSDEYGIKAEDMHWFQGGMDDPGRKDKWPNDLPAGFPITHLEGDKTINGMLHEGELDAFIGPRTPKDYRRDGSGLVHRLFENFEAVEKDYYRRSHIFPIMHPLGIRRELYEKHPWIALNLYLAFEKAKKISAAEMLETAALKIGHPWIVSATQDAQAVMGDDIFPYGVKESRPTLEAAIRYSMEQYMAVRPITIEEMFPPNTMDVPKV
jgi:4,5-dihydroxyphthalate decarboxylase